MGVITIFLDTIVFLFSLILSIVAPLFDAQSCLPSSLYPTPLTELNRWYSDQFGDYLTTEKPLFFVGLVWIELLLLWPLSVANVYGILKGKSWVKTTSLMAGVSAATSMAAIMTEILGSGRASERLIQMYSPFGLFAICAILRGFISRGKRVSSSSGSHGPSARKKRV
ncbi:hypothetical protein LUZ60_010747 [Juncus effusus]|nr:hypothetical protein LUZ60_010747 [Juncus effusus]